MSQPHRLSLKLSSWLDEQINVHGLHLIFRNARLRLDNIKFVRTKVTMNRQQAIEALNKLKPVLVERFGVTRLALFGSTVRNESKPESDIDIVVAFDGPATSAKYFGVQFYLEDVLGAPIDLVSEKAIRPELRPFIEREAVNV